MLYILGAIIPKSEALKKLKEEKGLVLDGVNRVRPTPQVLQNLLELYKMVQ